MSDWISAAITGGFDLLGGGLNSVYSAAAAKKQYEYNLALQKQAQNHQIKMYKHQNQWRVEDLRAAGLNPILATHAASSMPSASANSVSMPHSANFDFKDSSKAIARALFKRGQKENELLDAQINSAKAQADANLNLAKKYASESLTNDAERGFNFSPEVIRLRLRQMKYNSTGRIGKEFGIPDEVIFPDENSAYDGFRKQEERSKYERKQFWNSFKKDLKRNYKKSFPFLGF